MNSFSIDEAGSAEVVDVMEAVDVVDVHRRVASFSRYRFSIERRDISENFSCFQNLVELKPETGTVLYRVLQKLRTN